MDLKELLFAYAGKTLNQQPEQLAELLFTKSDDGEESLSENALNALLALEAQKVQAIKPNTKEYFDNGYKKAESEVRERVERELRERFGIDKEAQLKGPALLDAITAAMANETAKPDKVKTSTEYLELERTMRQKIEELQQQHTAEVEKIRQDAQRENTWGQVRPRIRDMVRKHEGLNQDAITDGLIDLLAEQFKGYEYQQDGDNFLPLQDGKRVENAHGFPRHLDELVRERAESIFPKIVQQPVGSAGNVNNGQGKPATGVTFKTEGELMAAYNAETDPAKRVEMVKAWEAQQARGN